MYSVYILKSKKNRSKIYIGLTNDLENRLESHNNSESLYSKKYYPWKLETCISFKSKDSAVSFEKYLKAGSGHAFLKRHLIPRIDAS